MEAAGMKDYLCTEVICPLAKNVPRFPSQEGSVPEVFIIFAKSFPRINTDV
jgi:hypothetical protein